MLLVYFSLQAKVRVNYLERERDKLLREKEDGMERSRAREKERHLDMLGKLKTEGLYRCV